MMKKCYDGSLITDCFSNKDGALAFIDGYFGENLSKAFIAIFDPEVNKQQMQEEIIEATKFSLGEEEC